MARPQTHNELHCVLERWTARHLRRSQATSHTRSRYAYVSRSGMSLLRETPVPMRATCAPAHTETHAHWETRKQGTRAVAQEVYGRGHGRRRTHRQRHIHRLIRLKTPTRAPFFFFAPLDQRYFERERFATMSMRATCTLLGTAGHSLIGTVSRFWYYMRALVVKHLTA